MSDVVIVAILGFTATAIGSLSSGYFTYKSAANQYKKEMEITNLKIKHDESVNHLERAIKLGNEYLSPLRDNLSRAYALYCEASEHLGEAGFPDKREKTIRLVESALSKIEQIDTENYFLVSHISNSELVSLARELLIKHADLDLILWKRWESFSESGFKDYHERTKTEFDVLNKRNELMVDYNTKVEKLLSGRINED